MNLQDHQDASWSADEFVDVVNRLLPDFLPEDSSSSRVRDEVNLRLVRHYTSLGMLDEPFKDGKKAVYRYRHLLQMLLVRRMLSQGYGSAAIEAFPRQQTDSQLYRLITGQLELAVRSNPALDYLEALRKRSGISPVAAPAPPPVSAPAPAAPGPSLEKWYHLNLLPGLELHIRRDFKPSSGAVVDQIAAVVRDALNDLRRKS